MENIWIEHRKHEYGYSLSRHYEHCYQLLLPISGRISYTVNDKTYEVGRGQVIVLNTLEDHSLEVLEYPYERYVLQIDPTFFQREVRYPEIISIFIKRPPNFMHCFSVPEPVWNYLYTIMLEIKEEFKARRQYWELFVGADLRRMFVTLLRECDDVFSTQKMDAGTAVAYKVINYLDKHYLDELNVDTVAGELFLNKHYISHAFKNATGYSIMDYVLTLRINHAKSLLVGTDKTITEVAETCGYTDFTYFSRIFKKKTGVPPTTFRKTAQKATAK